MSVRWTIVDADAAARLAAAGWGRYEDFLDRQAGDAVGHSGTTRTTRMTLRDGATPSDFYVKTYRYDGRRWRHRFRVDKATCEARNYGILKDLGLSAPRVVLYGRRTGPLRLRDALIVTEGITAAQDMATQFERRWQKPREARGDPLRQAVLDAVISMAARMHEAGFFHVDLQWRNILIGGLPSGCPRVHVLDCPRGFACRGGPRAEYGRLRDLSCLFKEARRRLTRVEQLRALLAYRGESAVSAGARRLVEALLRDRLVKDNEGDA